MHIVIRHGERVLHALPLPSGARLLVGRQPEGNDIVLPDPKASRRHGTLTLQGNHIHFTDHGSGNGTFIASKRIPPDTPTAIAQIGRAHV